MEQSLKQYLFGICADEILLSRIRAAIERNTPQSFLPDELQWLEAHFDKLPSIFRSKMACKIYMTVHRDGGAYTRQLCRRLSEPKRRVSPSTVHWWLLKFWRIGLLRRHAPASGWGHEIHYLVPKVRYPNLIRFLVTVMKELHENA